MDNVYSAIVALLATLFDTDYPVIDTTKFSGRPIFQGNQNDYTVPT